MNKMLKKGQDFSNQVGKVYKSMGYDDVKGSLYELFVNNLKVKKGQKPFFIFFDDAEPCRRNVAKASSKMDYDLFAIPVTGEENLEDYLNVLSQVFHSQFLTMTKNKIQKLYEILNLPFYRKMFQLNEATEQFKAVVAGVNKINLDIDLLIKKQEECSDKTSYYSDQKALSDTWGKIGNLLLEFQECGTRYFRKRDPEFKNKDNEARMTAYIQGITDLIRETTQLGDTFAYVSLEKGKVSLDEQQKMSTYAELQQSKKIGEPNNNNDASELSVVEESKSSVSQVTAEISNNITDTQGQDVQAAIIQNT